MGFQRWFWNNSDDEQKNIGDNFRNGDDKNYAGNCEGKKTFEGNVKS